ATQPSPSGPTHATATGVTPTVHNTTVLSLTSTGNDHQWVLGATSSPHCPGGECATLFARSGADSAWTSVGRLPAAAPSGRSGQHDRKVVSQLRFVGTSVTGYDAYAFGPDLLSAHAISGGAGPAQGSWRPATLPVAGQVRALEARGGSVYALVAKG